MSFFTQVGDGPDVGTIVPVGHGDEPDNEYINSKEFVNQQRAFFDACAGKKEWRIPVRIDLWKQFVGLDARIVDWGCGSGRVLKELIAAGYKNVEGLEQSPAMTEQSRKAVPDVTVSLLLSKRSQYANNTFDAVSLYEVLSCLCSSSDEVRLIDDIFRILKPGGILFIHDFLISEDDRSAGRYNNLREAYSKLDLPYGVFAHPEGVLQRHFERSFLKELVTSANFDVEYVLEDTFQTSSGRPHLGMTVVARKAVTAPLPLADPIPKSSPS